MAKELMEIGGFITEGAEIVNHDNTLSGNGTVDSPLGLNETVLYSGEEPTSAVSLSETWKNFDRLKIYVQNKSMDNGLNMVEVRPLERDGYTPYYNIIAGFSYGLGTNGMIWQNIIGSASDTGLRNCSAFGFQNSWTATSPTVRKNNANDLNCILKVVGINRIANN